MAHYSLPTSRLHVLASASSRPQSAEGLTIPSSRVTILRKHMDVFHCAWNPKSDILASASRDSTVRLWNRSRRKRSTDTSDHVVLPHDVDSAGFPTDTYADVTALEWNHDGTRLLTGSERGYARVWDKNGNLEQTLNIHRRPVFTAKWNKKGDRILTGSVDRSVIMYHLETGLNSQRFHFHTGAVLDLDWQTNARFASCSRDKSIIICELDSEDAICTLNGHTDEVNSIKWDPQGRILASASNDCTVKLWSVGADHRLRHDLTAHDGEVTSVKWSPTGPTTSFPNAPLYLASASQDDTVRLWDIEGGVCTRVFTGHNMALSPDGRFIAAGSDDNHVRMWSVQSEKLLQFYRSTSPFLDVSWNSTGTLVAACSAEGSVILFDLRY